MLTVAPKSHNRVLSLINQFDKLMWSVRWLSAQKHIDISTPYIFLAPGRRRFQRHVPSATALLFFSLSRIRIQILKEELLALVCGPPVALRVCLLAEPYLVELQAWGSIWTYL